jgi:hypothetical protein
MATKDAIECICLTLAIVSPAPPAGIGEVFVDRLRGPAHRGPSVAALGLERKGPVHVSVSGVAKGRCMVPPLGGLLD